MPPLPSLPSSYTRLTLLQRPTAAINPSVDPKDEGRTFTVERGVKMWEENEVEADEVVVRVEWVSIDPAMRGWLAPTRSYLPPVAIGAPMRALAVGRVAFLPSSFSSKTSSVSSSSSSRPPTVEGGNEKSAPLVEASSASVKGKALKVGDWVSGVFGWAEYAKVKVKDVTAIHVDDLISPTLHLGVLGMVGQTAFHGLFSVCAPKAGETVVVSGAAGAVGSLVCQLAKQHGCKVVAIAGGKEKCRWLKEEVGVESVLDYKQEWGAFVKEFREKVGYLDCYFDNVGGKILDLALTRLKKGARIALCGAISAYNDPSPEGLKMYLNLISQRAKIEGFIVFDYADRYAEAEEHITSLIRSSRLTVRETRVSGLENAPQALVDLFDGKNLGKMVVRVGEGAGRL
ncbi:hypothetical protein JCM6882_004491 [Rhodosporidiobolus microsporus]